ncbi:FAD-dependent monooxygenase [Phytomonospora sp. NPDC050363]|uniref:FAD-dependent monooxygenase n=1 Tax=Phytomonospora sp. NPDC050363 TaxID=3155642 RepID=UPI0033E5F4B9
MRDTTVLISGASIAGPALAYWLHRHGFTPTVVERATAVREGGYKLDVRGAALDVLDRMDLLEAARAAATDMRTGTIVDAEGKTLAVMDADLTGGRADGDVELMRGDLARILHDATRDDTEYLFGDSIASLTQHPHGVEVTFDSGTTRTFGLVIGADGLHSHTRRLVFGDETPYIRHLGHHIAIHTAPNHLGLDRREMIHPAPGRTALTYSTAGDTNAKAMYLFASPATPYDHRDTAHQKRLLAEAFTGARWEVPTLLAAAQDAPDFYFDSISQVVMDHWSRDRVALVGDAAYGPSPASGQGTSLSLVGAYVLAGELAAADGDHTVGYAAYEQRMRPFAEANQALAENNLKGMVMGSAALIWFQTRMLRLMPRIPGGRRMIARIADGIHRAATAIEIPDYSAAGNLRAGRTASDMNAAAAHNVPATYQARL